MLDRGDDLQRLGHAARPDLAAGELARTWADAHDAARVEGRQVRLGRRMRPHHQIHRRRDQHRLVGGEQSRRREIVGEPRRHAGDQIGARRRDDDEIGLARQPDMPHLALVGQRPEVVIDLVLAQRGNRQRRHEVLRRRGHDAANRGAALAQPADQIEALIGGDPAGNDQQNAPVLKQVGPPSVSRGQYATARGKGESYR